MSKAIRQKISHALQTTFRSSPKAKSRKVVSCCTVKKPDDYEYLPVEPKPTSAKSDYIDLSECHSWSLSKDSGFSIDRPLESTRISSSDSASLSTTVSDLSSIRSHSLHLADDPLPKAFECCHCRCHHYVHAEWMVDRREASRRDSQHQQRQAMKQKVYPFIF